MCPVDALRILLTGQGLAQEVCPSHPARMAWLCEPEGALLSATFRKKIKKNAQDSFVALFITAVPIVLDRSFDMRLFNELRLPGVRKEAPALWQPQSRGTNSFSR